MFGDIRSAIHDKRPWDVPVDVDWPTALYVANVGGDVWSRWVEVRTAYTSCRIDPSVDRAAWRVATHVLCDVASSMIEERGFLHPVWSENIALIRFIVDSENADDVAKAQRSLVARRDELRRLVEGTYRGRGALYGDTVASNLRLTLHFMSRNVYHQAREFLVDARLDLNGIAHTDTEARKFCRRCINQMIRDALRNYVRTGEVRP